MATEEKKGKEWKRSANQSFFQPKWRDNGRINLFFKDKIYCQYKKNKTNHVVGAECFCLENNKRESGKYGKCYNFLYYFEFYQAKRSTIPLEAYPVCRHLKAILKKRYAPTDKYYGY